MIGGQASVADYEYDLFVIGAGSGGVACSRRAASYGARVAICEDWVVGGTCVNRGCVPKKLLAYASRFGDAFGDAAGFGWRPERPAFDLARLIRDKDAEIQRLNGVYRTMLANSGVEYIEGRGALIDGYTVRVGERTFTSRYILVATGGRPWRPGSPGIEKTLTSNEALDLGRLPRRLTVVGGGYIAVEFACIFNGLGSEVTVLIRAEELLNGFDDDIRVALGQEMRKRGIETHNRCRLQRVEHDGRGFTVTAEDGRAFEAEQVLFATGRVPNTQGLGLEEAGVKLGAKGAIVVDEGYRSSVRSVFALGDCTDRVNLTPVAIAEGRALAETLFNDNPTSVDYSHVPTAVFSQPPISCVGLTEAQARERHAGIDVYVSRFRPMKHTLSGRDEITYMKMIVDRESDRVLGCHMLGMDAPEIIQGVAVALTCGATKAQFDATVGIHPTSAEEFVLMSALAPEPERGAAE